MGMIGRSTLLTGAPGCDLISAPSVSPYAAVQRLDFGSIGP